eukprot:2355974-Rhodomonas_salina.3
MPHLNTERDANALLLLTLVAFEPGEGDDGLAGRSVVLLVVSDSVQKCDCGGGYSAPYDNDHDHHLCRQSGYHDDDWNEQDHGDEDIDDALKLLVSETSEALKRGRAREIYGTDTVRHTTPRLSCSPFSTTRGRCSITFYSFPIAPSFSSPLPPSLSLSLPPLSSLSLRLRLTLHSFSEPDQRDS